MPISLKMESEETFGKKIIGAEISNSIVIFLLRFAKCLRIVLITTKQKAKNVMKRASALAYIISNKKLINNIL